jgi:molybdopterin-synthase adenylyltransferase
MTLVLLPSSIANTITAYGGPWGYLDLRHDPIEDVLVIDGYSRGDGYRVHGLVDWVKRHYTINVPSVHAAASWYKADLELHNAAVQTAARHTAVPLDVFREHVKGMREPDRAGGRFAITIATSSNGNTVYAGWVVSATGATYIPVEIVDETADLFAPLGSGWPQEALRERLVTIVGCGSIGSAAAEALAAYTVQNIALVDPDHLLQRNLCRHRVLERDLGRRKVNAIADMLATRDPKLTVRRYPYDVITNADLMRPLFAESACIVVCTDGVASRRAANHLACRAGVPAIFACVLEDGGIGEVLRVLPRRTACLFCSREKLLEEGSMDPEPLIDRGYAEGGGHRPMTAVGGDLDLVGRIAARVAVSTLLVQAGYGLERLPGDHAVIGLRPPPDLPASFDVGRTAAITWHALGAPAADCPSCGAPR